MPNGTKPESRVKRFARWFDNDHILEEVYFLPYADLLLRHCALQTLVLVMDGSVAGRGCMALMIHVVSKGRALPLAWRVRQGPKGHFPEDLHIALVELVSELEKAFGVKIPDSDLNPRQFESVTRIESYLESKREGRR